MPDLPDPCNVVQDVPGAGPALTTVCDVAINPPAAVGKAADAAGSGVSQVASGLVDSAFGKAAQSVGQAAGDLLKTAMTWWINTDSIQIDPTAIADTQRPLTGVFTLIMMLGVLTTAVLMIMQRRGDHAVNLLLGAAKYVAISTLSLLVLQGALGASDEVAQNLISNGSEKFGDNLAALLGVETLTNPALVLILGLICGLLALIQWVFGFIREAGILVLAAMIGIAAAGQLSTWGRQWFPRLASALVALVLYKPMAAMIFSIGFKYMGQGKDLATVVTGIMVVALAVIALPAMMKFFSFVGTGVGGGGSGMALAAAGAGLAARGAFGGGGGGGADGPDTATSVANHMEATGPGTGVQDTPPGPGEGGRGEAPTGGPGGGGGGGAGGAADVDGGESTDDGAGSGDDSTGDTPSSGRHAADDTSTDGGAQGDGSGSVPGAVPGEDTPDDGVGAASPAGAGALDGGEAAAAGGGAAGGGAAAAAGPVGAAAVAGAAALDAVSGAADAASSTMQGNDDERDES